MFLISWNVAGLSTTVSRIHDVYGAAATEEEEPSNDSSDQQQKGKEEEKKKKKAQAPKNQCQALADYFTRHGSPDIVCLQEHKIPKPQLSNRTEPHRCANVEGYESFWSCCVDEKSKGMNGVVTYCKKGIVRAANAFPFENSSLDDQGRCVMTDHGKFVVFNVYVPASGGHSVTKKMKFLQALRRVMKKQRQVHKKAVILVGDLNISHGKLDVYWKNRVLHVNDILRQVESTTDKSALLPWKLEVVKAWPIIVETMKTRKVVPTQTSNSLTGQKYERHRLCVTMENTNRTIYLGKHESNPEYCHCGYDFDLEGYYTDPETDEKVLACEANVIQISVLAELMSKVCNVEWSEETLRTIADSEDACRSRIHPPRQWLTTLLEEDDMVDIFRHFYPTAQARFTCWHQFTNTRYTNNGTRIDYTLVDRSLLPFVKRGGDLRTGAILDDNLVSVTNDRLPLEQELETTGTCAVDPLSEEAALAAATARGRFQPVSFEGGGIAEVSRETLNTQFGPQHTGMIYTPPSYSDHIAVSLLLGDDNDKAVGKQSQQTLETVAPAWRDGSWGSILLDERDPATRKAQPHKSQQSISSFFSNGGGSTKSIAMTSGVSFSNRTKLPQKRPAESIHFKSFFQAKPSEKSNAQNNGRNSKPKTTNTGQQSLHKKPPAHSILNHFAKK